MNFPSQDISDTLRLLQSLEQKLSQLATKQPEISQARHHLAEIRGYVRAYENWENRNRLARNKLAADIAAAEEMRSMTND